MMTIIILSLMTVAALYGADKAFRAPSVFLVLLLAAGPMLRFSVDASGVVGTDLSAIWILSLILLMIVILIRTKTPSCGWSWPESLYIIFLLWCAYEGARARDYTYAVRSFLRLLYPLLVMMLAKRLTIQSRELDTRLLKSLMVGAGVSCVFMCTYPYKLYPAPVGELISNLMFPGAPFADYASIICVITLGVWQVTGQKKYLALTLWLASSTVLAGVRTGILGFGVAASIFFVAEFKARAIPVLGMIYLAFATAVVFTPALNEKMFFEGSNSSMKDAISSKGGVDLEQINDDGRFQMWTLVMDRFFYRDPIQGSGLGATQAWFYTPSNFRGAATYGNVKVEHSEYVKLLCDTGIVGLSLFVFSLFGCLAVGWNAYSTGEGGMRGVLALGVLGGLPAFMICMGFDNALLYVICVAQYPFAFTGILSGLEARRRLEAAGWQAGRTKDSGPGRIAAGSRPPLTSPAT